MAEAPEWIDPDMWLSVTAFDLESGLQAAIGESFELAVLDIDLHGIQSHPIADILHERRIPFVFVSGYAGCGIDPRFSKVPPPQKPFTFAALDQVLTDALRPR